MEYKFIKVSTSSKVIVLELNRPSKMNALCIDMVEEINHCFTSLTNRTDIHALIIKGNNEFFCAGGDLKEMQALTNERATKRSQYVQSTFRILNNLPFPAIAFISGICFGGGLELALHCDYRIACTNTKMAFPEVKYGMIPGAGGTVLLAEAIPYGDAMYYLTSCENIPFEKAINCGLIQKSFEAEKSEEALNFQIEYFNKCYPDAVNTIKKLQINKNNNTINQQYEQESSNFALLLTKNGKKGIQNKFK